MKKPIVWTIAGSDSGGGAGIQADLHTFQNLGVYGCSVITAVTAQNSTSVSSIHAIPAENVAAQISALAQDLKPKAIKLGMLGESKALDSLIRYLSNYSGPIIFDPVLVSTSRHNLFQENIEQRIAAIKLLIPLCTLITPNLPEAEQILGTSINTYTDIIAAAQKFLSIGAKSVIIKGGHLTLDKYSQDYWTDGKQAFWIACERRSNAQFHGTGCSFASAIAAALALDYSLYDSLVISKMYVTQGIYNADKYGAGPEPVAHCGWPSGQQPLPYLSREPIIAAISTSPDCGPTPLGLYPVVNSVSWLQTLLPLGISTIQLRIKNKTGSDLENEIKAAIEMAKKFNARLFINDYWELAIAHGAYGVHLGQEDLDTADLGRIKDAGLHLGISTHNYYELARAHALKPSYIALGHIFPTTSKIMPHPPQGIPRLKQWRDMLNYPLVAIGGINSQRLPAILETGVDGVALISAITQAADPVKTTQQLLEFVNGQLGMGKNKAAVKRDQLAPI